MSATTPHKIMTRRAFRRTAKTSNRTIDDLVAEGRISAYRTITGRSVIDTGRYFAELEREGYQLIALDPQRPNDLTLLKPVANTASNEKPGRYGPG